MKAVCSVDWTSIFPNAPAWMNTNRQDSQVTISKEQGRDYVYMMGLSGGIAPSKGFYVDSAASLPAAQRTSIGRDLRACAAKQPRGSQIGVQLRRAASAF